ncbi:MAG: NDP-sugar synthase [Syntrophomonadaceae bacterium]|nr:NDP-sugar synthase [Syntrophomonadaceae bacterium]MDD4549083.1 NDP-sugar synthase [Syntrophomonadaceae bacterium]
MKAMIMAAGVGSRLMPLTMNIPKPMVPMGNRPLMENIVRLLKIHGFEQIIANLHYHARVISDHFGDGSSFGVELKYSVEDELLGTAGGVKNCEWFLDDTFVIASGDALTDVDLTKLMAAHRKNGALATIALKEVDEVEHFGVVVTDDNGRIKRFQEKPRASEALSHNANTGIYIFEPEIFKYIPARQFYDFGKQVFPHLVKAEAPFYGVPIDDYWCDVGNIDTYRQAHEDIVMGRVRVLTSGQLQHGLDNKAHLLMGEGTTLGDNVKCSGIVVLGAGCKIGDNAVINNAVIWDNSVVGAGSNINEAVIGADCVISSAVTITADSVIASGCKIN